jgi:hypothetical protein
VREPAALDSHCPLLGLLVILRPRSQDACVGTNGVSEKRQREEEEDTREMGRKWLGSRVCVLREHP